MANKYIFLFDLDGTLLNTDIHYTPIWSRIGEEYLGLKDFGNTIKGVSLDGIFCKYFKDNQKAQAEIRARVQKFEREELPFEPIKGAREFLSAVKKAGYPSAIVTSSDKVKMAITHERCPWLQGLVDIILTGEDFERAKPDPDCFLKGMKALGGIPENTIVFEDSIHGLAAGRASGAKVVGLATSYPKEFLSDKCHMAIDDFRDLGIEDLLTDLY